MDIVERLCSRDLCMWCGRGQTGNFGNPETINDICGMEGAGYC